jgi:hypothetical protein
MTDLRYAFRQLIKSPSFSATAIFALALGIGATTAMFAVIYAFLLRPLPFADPEKLVMLQSRSTRSGSDLGVNYLDFVDWQKQSRSFADMAFFNLRWNGNLESRRRIARRGGSHRRSRYARCRGLHRVLFASATSEPRRSDRSVAD